MISHILFPVVGAILYFNYKSAQDHPLVEPVGNVSIVMPTYNEESNISMALGSLSEQTVVKKFPEKFETIIVDSNSEDATVDIANNFGAKVYEIEEKGILTARSFGIEKAKGDIIVSTNADTYYPKEWLGNVLYHFNDPRVVGVNSPALYLGNDIEVKLANLAMRLYRPMENIMSGRGSAFRKDAYYMAGGFNLDINQLDSAELQPEEEIYFRKRLEKFGEVVFEFTPVFTQFRRFRCSTNLSDKYCREIETGKRFSEEMV